MEKQPAVNFAIELSKRNAGYTYYVIFNGKKYLVDAVGYLCKKDKLIARYLNGALLEETSINTG